LDKARKQVGPDLRSARRRGCWIRDGTTGGRCADAWDRLWWYFLLFYLSLARGLAPFSVRCPLTSRARYSRRGYAIIHTVFSVFFRVLTASRRSLSCAFQAPPHALACLHNSMNENSPASMVHPLLCHLNSTIRRLSLSNTTFPACNQQMLASPTQQSRQFPAHNPASSLQPSFPTTKYQNLFNPYIDRPIVLHALASLHSMTRGRRHESHKAMPGG
jgi:hypothetical protein